MSVHRLGRPRARPRRQVRERQERRFGRRGAGTGLPGEIIAGSKRVRQGIGRGNRPRFPTATSPRSHTPARRAEIESPTLLDPEIPNREDRQVQIPRGQPFARPSSRSTMQLTATTFAPACSTASTALRTEVPWVNTSSRTTTRARAGARLRPAPGCRGPWVVCGRRTPPACGPVRGSVVPRRRPSG